MQILRSDHGRICAWLQKNVEVGWGRQFVSYETDGKSVTAFFDDDSSVVGRLLVGTDGVNSTGWPQLTNFPFLHTLTLAVHEQSMTGLELQPRTTLLASITAEVSWIRRNTKRRCNSVSQPTWLTLPIRGSSEACLVCASTKLLQDISGARHGTMKACSMMTTGFEVHPQKSCCNMGLNERAILILPWYVLFSVHRQMAPSHHPLSSGICCRSRFQKAESLCQGMQFIQCLHVSRASMIDA